MSYTLEELKAQEETFILDSFDSNVAWELGSIMRTNSKQKYTRSVVIYIAHANSNQLLFFATSGPGTLPDNMNWVKRKEAVVLRWGVSTMRMRLEMEKQHPGRTSQQALQDTFEMADPSPYGLHGGGFPIRVKNVEGVVGVVMVSGLTMEEDHEIIVDGFKEYLAKHK